MNDITRDFTAAVQCLPADLRWQASERTSTRDTRGCWTLRDGDGNELMPPPPTVKAESGSRPVSSATLLRVCREIGELFGRVESRIAALESGGTKADTTRALPSDYLTKDVKPRARWNGGAWVVASGGDIWAATSREATP